MKNKIGFVALLLFVFSFIAPLQADAKGRGSMDFITVTSNTDWVVELFCIALIACGIYLVIQIGYSIAKRMITENESFVLTFDTEQLLFIHGIVLIVIGLSWILFA